jgi:hypothetical protein
MTTFCFGVYIDNYSLSLVNEKSLIRQMVSVKDGQNIYEDTKPYMSAFLKK